MPVIDSLIASIGNVNNMTIVTRDTGGMKNSDVQLFNSWHANGFLCGNPWGIKVW